MGGHGNSCTCDCVGDIATKEGFESMYSLSALYHIPDNKKLPAMLVVHGGTDYIISIT